ncbi:MAG: MBL fold metallo-hydrolase [Pseudomonadota bacterium]
MSTLPNYPFKEPPPGGDSIEVAPGVRWLRMPLPFALDHINLWLLADGDGWTIVDTGFASDAVKTCWETLLARLAQEAALPEPKIKRIIVTHFHPDHFGLASWLQEKTKAPIYMTQGEYLTAHAVWHEIGGHSTEHTVNQFQQHGLDQARCAALAERRGAYRRGAPNLPNSYCRLFDRDELTIGQHQWQVRAGFGHSPEHAALYCAELGVLISGDMLLPKISTNISVFAATPRANSLADYLDSLDDYRELPDTTFVLPSHGLPFYGMTARIDAQHAHHAERLDVLEACCTTPHSAADLLPSLFNNRTLDTHQTFFAMGEAIAHLNYLEHLGRLKIVPRQEQHPGSAPSEAAPICYQKP